MTGMRNFNGRRTLAIISKIKETDTRIKGIDNVNTPAGELMKELIAFILE
jgi:DNA polymerase-3 subunit delta